MQCRGLRSSHGMAAGPNSAVVAMGTRVVLRALWDFGHGLEAVLQVEHTLTATKKMRPGTVVDQKVSDTYPWAHCCVVAPGVVKSIDCSNEMNLTCVRHP